MQTLTARLMRRSLLPRRSLSVSSSSKSSSDSLDAREVSNFDSLARSWWTASGPNNWVNPLIDMNPTRVDYIKTIVSRHSLASDSPANALSLARRSSSSGHFPGRLPPNLSVADIGAGGGILTESLLRLGVSRVLSVEPSPALSGLCKRRVAGSESIARRRTGLEPPTFYNGPVEAYIAETQPDPRGTFDVVCCLEVLEHVPSPSALLAAMSSLLRPPSSSPSSASPLSSSLLFVSTISPTSPLSYPFAVFLPEYVTGHLPPGTHHHSKFISPATLSEMMPSSRSSTLSSSNSTPNHPSSQQRFSLQRVSLAKLSLKNPVRSALRVLSSGGGAEWRWDEVCEGGASDGPKETDSDFINYIAAYKVTDERDSSKALRDNEE